MTNINRILSSLSSYKLINFDPEINVTCAKNLIEADEFSVVWISETNPNKFELANNTLARLIICDKSFSHAKNLDTKKCYVLVDDPRLSILRIIKNNFIQPIKWGIHSTSIISSKAKIDFNSYIGPNCVIGNAVIGKGTIIRGNCFIHDDVTIGEDVIIEAGTVIGSDGYGFQRNENSEFEKFPHIGGVVINNNVEIGANSCIDRGTLGNTVIGEGVKIDNLVHIAHNTQIGNHSAIIANSTIGGSARIGEYTWIAPNSCIRDGISVGDYVTIGLGSVVTKSIPSNEVWVGNPAKLFKK
jgi:UDP-3-O-[3-hydroxymyristoyl] glucosamine N-acyltransferase